MDKKKGLGRGLESLFGLYDNESNKNITKKNKTGEGGRVFGSVTSKQICEELQKKYQIHVDKRKFLDNESINSCGVTYVKVDLYRNKVIGQIKVHVSEL